MEWIQLAMFSGAVYGLSWGLAESGLFEPVREWVGWRANTADILHGNTERTEPGAIYVPSRRARAWAMLNELVHCVVCTSAWVGLAVALALPGGTWIAHPPTAVDLVVLVSWGVFTTWGVAVASSR